MTESPKHVIRANVHIRVNGTVADIIRPHVIVVESDDENRGTILRDGRPVVREDDKWYYDPQ